MIKKLIAVIHICMFFDVFCQYKDFVIVVPSYNNASYYKVNLNSIFSQQYPRKHYRMIYVDDCSDDNTYTLVQEYIAKKGFERTTVIQHKHRTGPLKSRYDAVHTCADHEIVVILDGDDWFTRSNVLMRLN